MGKSVYLTTEQIVLLQRVLAPGNFVAIETDDEEYDIRAFKNRDEILEKLSGERRHRLWKVHAERSYQAGESKGGKGWVTVFKHRNHHIQINLHPSPLSEHGLGYRIDDPTFLPEDKRYNTVQEAVEAIDEKLQNEG